MTAVDKPVLILGAGINGAAIARELLLNRIPVCVVDTADIASGATAYSSRLIHGGLRYLEYGDFDLVRQSIEERGRLLVLAPQFVKPLRLFIPVERRLSGVWPAMKEFFGRDGKGKSSDSRGLWLVQAGLRWYDSFSKATPLPRHSVHRLGDANVPPVDTERYRWACSYYDGQIEFPERFVLALLEDARRLATQQKTWFRVYAYHEVALRHRTVEIRRVGPTSSSLNTNRSKPAHAFEPSAIINATGAWVDRTLKHLRVDSQRLMGGTKGSHFLTSNSAVRQALQGNGVYAEAADGRPVFLLPLGEATLVGTTDLPFEDSPETAVASEDELEYLLTAVNHVFPQVSLTRSDIAWHYSGVRPLPYADDSTPAAVTRRHRLEEHADCPLPLYSLIGGKLTTCRLAAEETVAAIGQRLHLNIENNSRDRTIPGGDAFPVDSSALDAEHQRLTESLHLSRKQIRAVWRLCGTSAESCLRDLNSSALRDVTDRANLTGTNLPARFVRRVIRSEWVTRLTDLVERRLMLLYEGDLSEQCLRQLARMMIDEGVLAESQLDEEVEFCKTRLWQHFGKRLHTTRHDVPNLT